MKRCVVVAMVVFFGLVLQGSLFAQSPVDEEELVKSVLQTEKKAIIVQNMGFTDDESKAFWPVYNEFQGAKQKLNERTIKMLKDYLAGYETLSQEKADGMIKEYLAIEKERLDLKTSYLPKFMKVMPAKKVARYYQIENKLEAIIKYELVKEVPLVK